MNPQIKKAVTRNKRKIGPYFVTTILMLVALSSFLVFLPTTARAEWWDSDYEHCKTLTLANSVDSFKGMLVNVTYASGGDVDCESSCQADFDDIRFTSIDNSTALDYWREEYVASTWAHFWVELPANVTATDKIVMYYANPTAEDGSDGDATFYYWDDWASNTTSEWMMSTGQSGGNDVIRHMQQVVTGVGYDTRLRYRTNKSLWTTAAGGVSNRVGYCNQTYDVNNYVSDDAIFCLDTPDTGEGSDATHIAWRVYIRDDGSYGTLPDFKLTTFDPPSWYIYEQVLISTNYTVNLYDDGDNYLGRSYSTDVVDPGIPPEAELSRIYLGSYYGSGGTYTIKHDARGYLKLGGYRTSGSYNHMFIDFMFLGDYLATEPSVSSAGAEDTRLSQSTYTLTGLTGPRLTWAGQENDVVWCNGSGTYLEDIEIQLNVTDSDNVTDVLVRMGNLNDTGAYVNASNFTLYTSSNGADFAIVEHNLGNGNGIYLDSATGVNMSINSTTWPSSGAGADPFPIAGGGPGVWDNASIYLRVKITIPAGQSDDYYYEANTWYVYPGYYS